MSITYTWKVTGVKTQKVGVNGTADAVVQTYWQKIGTDESGNTGTFSGATPFRKEDIDPATFVPFDQLTEEIVLGWIQAVVVGGYGEHVDNQIQKQIDEKINAVEEPSLPWAPPTPTPEPPPAPVPTEPVAPPTAP